MSPPETDLKHGRRPTTYIPFRRLVILTICLPTLTVYSCVISTFFTHFEIRSNYSIPDCTHVKSFLAPVSNSIAMWQPQKELWLLAIIIHLPARFLLMLMIPQVWALKSRRYAFHVATTVEILALICLSLFHHDQYGAYFYIHFAGFGSWWIASTFVMSVIIYMQRATGRIYLVSMNHRLWLAKIVILFAFIIGSITITVSYPYATSNCSLAAFTMFCVGEYFLIALSATFWSLVFFEVSKDFGGFRLELVQERRRNGNKIHPESHPTESIRF